MPRASLFVPILAGAPLRERAVGCLGALVGIALTAATCRLALGGAAPLPVIVAPMGASAVLLFAVPASPLAQPWPIVGGNVVSALVGVAVARAVPDPDLAMGLAVALAIAAMSFARCLHPPGGAAALTAVIGGPAVASAGYLFAFVPVALNAVLLVLVGVAVHRLTRRAYPHRPAPVVAGAHLRAPGAGAPAGALAGIAPDASVALDLVQANHDPAAFPDPFALVEARPGRALAFGLRAHACIGAAIAHDMLGAVLAILLGRNARLVGPSPTWAPHPWLHRIGAFRIALDRRIP